MRFHPEKQYIDLIKKILTKGSKEQGRNGNVYKWIGSQMRYPLIDNEIPILTTKKMAWDVCLKELLWFISGRTDNTILQEQGVKIWNGNSTREYLDSRGLHDNFENDLGPIYGHQWRYFNAHYYDADWDYKGKGIDQIGNVIKSLNDEKERYSRRIIMSAWNPCQLDQMALPPCHVLAQFHVTSSDHLRCNLYQRSADVGLGLPFNIASYGFLTHLIAHHCNLKPVELIHTIGDAHIYEEHVKSLEKQIERIPYTFPKLKITNHCCEEIDEYEFEDFEIINYEYHKRIKMDMLA